MSKGAHHCQNCDMHGRKGVLATQVYRGYNGETTFACDSCHADALNLLKAFGATGPYNGELGSKGIRGRVSFGKGKAGEMRRAAYNFVLKNGPHGADEMAKKLGYHWHSFRPRCSELATEEYESVFRQGDAEAPTARGGKQHVYEINYGAHNDQVRETQQRRPRASAFSDPQEGHESQGRDDLRRTARP